MYCEHCGKKISENTQICQSCGNTLLESRERDPVYDAYVAERKKKSRDNAILILCFIFVVFIMLWILWDHDKPYRERSRVNADHVLADSVHTAMLTAMLDPEIMNRDEYTEDLNALMSEFDITQCTGDENCILEKAAQILLVDDLHELGGKPRSHGATGRILVKVYGPTQVQVVIEGTYYDMTGEVIEVR